MTDYKICRGEFKRSTQRYIVSHTCYGAQVYKDLGDC